MIKTAKPRLMSLPLLAVLALSSPRPLPQASEAVPADARPAPVAAIALAPMPAAVIAAAAAVRPGAPAVAAPVPFPALQPIERDRDGLFYLDAEINGTQVRFLVDTGATTVTLTPADARRIGTAARSRPSLDRMQTASGSAAIRWARVERMRIGRQELRDLDAVIVGEGLPVSLLGQNALAKFGSVTITGHRLHLG